VKNISPEGELLQTSFGTGMGSDLEFYRQIPLTSMPYGQAMAILCLTEYLRKYF
jgi:unsaturated rhamnogalacturonyl hydrolase